LIWYLCDIKMPKMDGLKYWKNASELEKQPQFIMISAHGSIETAVEATKKGAFDLYSKTPDLNRLLLTVEMLLDKKNLGFRNKSFKKKISQKLDMVGKSAAIKDVKDTIEKVAPTEARVLITGPNGTGKELVAHWLHKKAIARCSIYSCQLCSNSSRTDRK
jgi:two-component system, NtrC family, nitrogen regulation response regulator NtrX